MMSWVGTLWPSTFLGLLSLVGAIVGVYISRLDVMLEDIVADNLMSG